MIGSIWSCDRRKRGVEDEKRVGIVEFRRVGIARLGGQSHDGRERSKGSIDRGWCTVGVSMILSDVSGNLWQNQGP